MAERDEAPAVAGASLSPRFERRRVSRRAVLAVGSASSSPDSHGAQAAALGAELVEVGCGDGVDAGDEMPAGAEGDLDGSVAESAWMTRGCMPAATAGPTLVWRRSWNRSGARSAASTARHQ
jgi:hypothetical protein